MQAALFAFPEFRGPASAVAARLGCRFHEVRLHHFPDGESLVQVDAPPPIALLCRSLDNPNAKLVEILLAASALRDWGCGQVVLIAPYLAYMRQDIAFEPGQAVSQKVIGAILARHFDGVLTVDPHLHRTPSLAAIMPGTKAVSLSAAPVLAQAIDFARQPVLIGPDAESRQWVEAIANPLGLEVLVGEKQRLDDREVELSIPGIDRVRGRPVILVDDVISSGGTLETAARLLLDAGATSVEALATHCLASAENLARLREAGISPIRSTDGVSGPTAEIPLAQLLAEAINENGWLGQQV